MRESSAPDAEPASSIPHRGPQGHPGAPPRQSDRRDPVIIRSRLVPWAVGFFGLLAVGTALLSSTADTVGSRSVLVTATAVLLVLAVRGARLRLVCGDEGLTAHRLAGTSTYPWTAVDRIGVADETVIGARLADGRWVHLLQFRGLGDTSTTRAAEQVDHELGMRAPTPPTMAGWRRRPPPPRWVPVVGLVLSAAGIVGYSVVSGNWFLAVFFAIQFALQRKYGDRAERSYRPVGAGAHREEDLPAG